MVLFSFFFLAFFASAPFVSALTELAQAEDAKPVTPADELPLVPDMPCSAAPKELEPFRIALSPDQEQRAQELFRKSIVVTAHDHCIHPQDFVDWQKSGITARVIKPTVDGIYWLGGRRHDIRAVTEGWFERGMEAIKWIKERVDDSDGRFVVVRKTEEIAQSKAKGKGGVILSFEGARPLEGKVENLEKFYRAGLRELQLYWAVESPVKNKDGSLSDFGKQVIREMDRLGIVLDLSHTPDSAFWAAMEVSQRPMVVSHTATFELSQRGDTLNEERIRAIARKRGAICLHFYASYIKARRGPKPTVEDLVDHIDYIKKLVGIDYAALGPDWFPERSSGEWIQGGQYMWSLPNVVREMVRRGYSDEEISKFLGGNLLRVYKEVWK